MLSIGIVGLPNVGKSTLFKALTKKTIDISNYPFTTIDPNVGIVAVPDERLEVLTKLSQSAKTVPTTIEFIDIAGLVKGAAEGAGLGNKFLANIREVDAIAQVIRVFEDENITHVHSKIDPADDIAVINTELMLADLETVLKRIDKSKRDPKAKDEIATLEKIKTALEGSTLAKDISLDDKEKEIAQTLNLLTNKPFIYVLNVSEKQLKSHWQPDSALITAMAGNNYVVLSTALELFLSELSSEEQTMMLEELGVGSNQTFGINALIKTGYKALGLITFLTTGPDESRAWTATKGMLIPKASRAIHTDFERLFIRADVIAYSDLVEAGSEAKARQTGKLRTVGKDYIIQDGDVVEIKIGA